MQTDITQAEAVLCSTVIAQPVLLDDIILSHTDFYDEQYGLIFRTASYLHEKGKSVTMFTVIDKLSQRVDEDHIKLACDVTTAQPWAIEEHARIIREASSKRRVMKTAYRLMEIVETSRGFGDSELAEVEKAFAEISASVESDKGPVLIADVMPEYYTILDERYKNRGKLTGITTGFRELNAYIGGWQSTDLCIIAARPSMGKTAFMLQTATAASRNDEVAVFSIEMGKYTLVDRLVASESFVPLLRIRNGRIEDDKWATVTDAMAVIGTRRFWVDDNSDVTVSYLRSRIRRIKRNMEPGKRLVVFVDYLQIMKSDRRGRSKTEEIAEISTELKALAKEMNCCVVALAQLNRSVEARKDKRPTLGDIKESGQIEQDADVIMFLYRDEYYNPETEQKSTVEIIIGKNRNGPTGTATIGFAKEFQKFIDVDKPDNPGGIRDE